MKILFCSRVPLSRQYGASRVLLDLGEALEDQGWQCDLRGPSDICIAPNVDYFSFSSGLEQYLRSHAHKYDVVEYDHEFLPVPRHNFSKHTLFVARSVLLVHHLNTIRIPQPTPNFKARIVELIKKRNRLQQIRINNATKTLLEADLINVANNEDKIELTRIGLMGEKIVVLPFGLSSARIKGLDVSSSLPPERPKVAFVGTFDYRKGASDFPAIVTNIVQAIPNVSFRFLGTSGLFKTAEEVLDFFSESIRHHIEVVPHYKPEELPAHLRDCSMGIFPSYIEGFPFGVLEMLGASLPVVAYNSPGPPMMLPSRNLVSRGDVSAMSARIIELLKDRKALEKERKWARSRATEFNWNEAARQTSDIYTQKLSLLRHGM